MAGGQYLLEEGKDEFGRAGPGPLVVHPSVSLKPAVLSEPPFLGAPSAFSSLLLPRSVETSHPAEPSPSPFSFSSIHGTVHFLQVEEHLSFSVPRAPKRWNRTHRVVFKFISVNFLRQYQIHSNSYKELLMR